MNRSNIFKPLGVLHWIKSYYVGLTVVEECIDEQVRNFISRPCIILDIIIGIT